MNDNSFSSRLVDREILFGVTGGIACYKSVGWVRNLVKEDARVTVLMSGAAARFVTPLTFGALSGNPVHVDLFDESRDYMSHISLARQADIFLIAPLTAQTLSRLAHGMADNLLATVALATKAPVVLCPAMNSNMLAHPATQRNLRLVKELGYLVVQPAEGSLACGEEGQGRLPEWDVVREFLLTTLSENDLAGHHIVITAGPTREAIDPVRYLSNRSSGKMGYALARTAKRRGAGVTLVSGPVALDPPPGVQLIPVMSAREMYDAVMDLRSRASIIVKAAAVADFRPSAYRERKIKKATAKPTLQLTKNNDILADLGRISEPSGKKPLLVGFAAESHDHLEEGARKLQQKNIDLIAVNDISGKDTGFDVDTNKVFLIDRRGTKELALMSKEATADGIWDHVISLMKE